MITSMHIENFKCFKDFDIELGQFNVLIGSNDSGKTAFLQAVQVVSAAGEKGGAQPVHLMHEFELDLGTFFWQDDRSKTIRIEVRGSVEDQAFEGSHGVVEFHYQDAMFRIALGVEGGKASVKGRSREDALRAQNWFAKAVGKARYCVFSPRVLKKEAAIIRSGGVPEFQMTIYGEGLPTFLEEILRDERQSFFDLENAFYKSFPHYVSMKIKKDGKNNVLRFKPRKGQMLESKDISDGAILYLAYLAVTHQPNPSQILLIEEPENGVHHASLKKIVSALREMSQQKGVQVILTTHSPYLLDLVKPEEVRVFMKDKEGAVHATKMSDAPEIEDMKKHFMTGEMWTCLSEEGLVGKPGVESE